MYGKERTIRSNRLIRPALTHPDRRPPTLANGILVAIPFVEFSFPGGTAPSWALAADSGRFAMAYAEDDIPNPNPFPPLIPSPDNGLYVFDASAIVERRAGSVTSVLGVEFDIDGSEVILANDASGSGIQTCDAGTITPLMGRIKTEPNGDLIYQALRGKVRSEGGPVFFEGFRRLLPAAGPPLILLDEGL